MRLVRDGPGAEPRSVGRGRRRPAPDARGQHQSITPSPDPHRASGSKFRRGRATMGFAVAAAMGREQVSGRARRAGGCDRTGDGWLQDDPHQELATARDRAAADPSRCWSSTTASFGIDPPVARAPFYDDALTRTASWPGDPRGLPVPSSTRRTAASDWRCGPRAELRWNANAGCWRTEGGKGRCSPTDRAVDRRIPGGARTRRACSPWWPRAGPTTRSVLGGPKVQAADDRPGPHKPGPGTPPPRGHPPGEDQQGGPIWWPR